MFSNLPKFPYQKKKKKKKKLFYGKKELKKSNKTKKGKNRFVFLFFDDDGNDNGSLQNKEEVEKKNLENVEELEALGNFKRKNKKKMWMGGGKGGAQLEANGALDFIFFPCKFIPL